MGGGGRARERSVPHCWFWFMFGVLVWEATQDGEGRTFSLQIQGEPWSSSPRVLKKASDHNMGFRFRLSVWDMGFGAGFWFGSLGLDWVWGWF